MSRHTVQRSHKFVPLLGCRNSVDRSTKWSASTSVHACVCPLYQTWRIWVLRLLVSVIDQADFLKMCIFKVVKANRNNLWHTEFLANVNSSSRSLYRRPSVCLSSVVCLSVTFVRPTQAIEIFGTFSSPFGTLAICWHLGKILRRSSHENPSVGGVKHNRGSRI